MGDCYVGGVEEAVVVIGQMKLFAYGEDVIAR